MTLSSAGDGTSGWNLDHSYARLPESLFVHQPPVPVENPRMVVWNTALADDLGLKESEAAIFSGNSLPPGSHPIAQAYAGHQFGNFTMLGDGRAVLLGEQRTPSGKRWDVQLKGSGPTPFSRRGDGRAALGPMLREYIVSEAMHALNIPTTRSLAVVATGELVYRETPLPGAILTRIAASHIRVGTFEYAARLGDEATLRALLSYTVNRHYPNLAEMENPSLAFFEAVMDAQAALIAKWLLVGFIHGVMNTDNMALSGETIDYGPCAFMDEYDPMTVFSSIDRNGRYAYGNQPNIAQWNLARLAECLLPLLDSDARRAVEIAEASLARFPDQFRAHWLSGMRAKLGLQTEEAGDLALVESLLLWMKDHRADYTNTFRVLIPGGGPSEKDPDFLAWHSRWSERVGREPGGLEVVQARMRAANPAVIPRNHRVQEALTAAVERQDLAPLHRLLAALRSPYEESPDALPFRNPPSPEERVHQTFCGT